MDIDRQAWPSCIRLEFRVGSPEKELDEGRARHGGKKELLGFHELFSWLEV